MSKSEKFNFGNDSVAKAYDSILVPVLFEAWAKSLMQTHPPVPGNKVLDLACGTGVVTKELVQHLPPDGRVIALDINTQMLDLAKTRCAAWATHIDFREGTADSLEIPENSLDQVFCQQGFQFFPRKKKVAQELYRVLKAGGTAVLTTWRHVSECDIFHAICQSLEALDLHDISQLMRIPFDVVTEKDLLDSFSDTGFSSIQLAQQEADLYLPRGKDQAVTFAYSTPIGPKLRGLEMKRQDEFKHLLLHKMGQLHQARGSAGRMTSNVLMLEK
ncbi:MAG: class I SAM-dependent methyltransferase [Bacteroidota bacterium]